MCVCAGVCVCECFYSTVGECDTLTPMKYQWFGSFHRCSYSISIYSLFHAMHSEYLTIRSTLFFVFTLPTKSLNAPSKFTCVSFAFFWFGFIMYCYNMCGTTWKHHFVFILSKFCRKKNWFDFNIFQYFFTYFSVSDANFIEERHLKFIWIWVLARKKNDTSLFPSADTSEVHITALILMTSKNFWLVVYVSTQSSWTVFFFFIISLSFSVFFLSKPNFQKFLAFWLFNKLNDPMQSWFYCNFF